MNVTITNIRKLAPSYAAHVAAQAPDGASVAERNEFVVNRVNFLLRKLAKGKVPQRVHIAAIEAEKRAMLTAFGGKYPTATRRSTSRKATAPKATATTRRTRKATAAKPAPKPAEPKATAVSLTPEVTAVIEAMGESMARSFVRILAESGFRPRVSRR